MTTILPVIFDSTDICAYLRTQLAATVEYAAVKPIAGLGTDLVTQQRGMKDRQVIVTVGNGPGFQTEWHIERVVAQLRIIGRQQSELDGEKFANQVHYMMICDEPVMVGRVRSLGVWPVTGRPARTMVDAARRAHFTCSYIFPVESGL